ncbi:MAG: hypothetical protein ACFCBU_09855 [Cyanophyceae cyanobacterium]
MGTLEDDDYGQGLFHLSQPIRSPLFSELQLHLDHVMPRQARGCHHLNLKASRCNGFSP